ncbi:tail fiber protein, partial [Salmonella enterica subsp. enterica serovar Thompson]|nr:phage tail protein [Salmonella enterica subsp. enterica serovar Thompson]EHG1033765.1 tail fiber protein [Salmonella enterica subsp. enterica serovar Thompson]EHG4723501.1 tail fiber protein [Salmonella enterica subsp. enterica serovar Thompson]
MGEGSALPVGVPVPWPLPNPPEGWLKYNGAPFDKNRFPKLGTVYPAGILPDLRGEFIRGWDDGRGVDSGRVLNSLQDSDNKAHIHDDEYSYGGGGAGGTNGTMSAFAKKYCTASDVYKERPSGGWLQASSGLHTMPSGGNESRPRNIALCYIVRAA